MHAPLAPYRRRDHSDTIAPILLATRVGAEVIRPMAAPVLGGLLIADEVIDVFLPVLYFAVCKRRWAKARRISPWNALALAGN